MLLETPQKVEGLGHAHPTARPCLQTVHREAAGTRDTVNADWGGEASLWGGRLHPQLDRRPPAGRGCSGREGMRGRGGAPGRSHAHADALDDLKDGWKQRSKSALVSSEPLL